MGVAGEDDTEDGTHGDAAAIRDLLRERLEVGREGDGDAVIPDTRSTSAAAFGSGVGLAHRTLARYASAIDSISSHIAARAIHPGAVTKSATMNDAIRITCVAVTQFHSPWL
jgi:CxxC motif-containing protein (DUF1111 family)